MMPEYGCYLEDDVYKVHKPSSRTDIIAVCVDSDDADLIVEALNNMPDPNAEPEKQNHTEVLDVLFNR